MSLTPCVYLFVQCAVVAWQAIEQARAWSQAASYWAGGAGLAVLPALKDLLRHAGQAHGAARSSHAARWLADDDIVRFLRNLPNWRAATQVWTWTFSMYNVYSTRQISKSCAIVNANISY